MPHAVIAERAQRVLVQPFAADGDGDGGRAGHGEVGEYAAQTALGRQQAGFRQHRLPRRQHALGRRDGGRGLRNRRAAGQGRQRGFKPVERRRRKRGREHQHKVVGVREFADNPLRPPA